MQGAIEILRERLEQVYKHDRTILSDVKNNNRFQLVHAATQLISFYKDVTVIHDNEVPEGWNPKIWENFMKKPYKDRLVIAGALLAAEYDRIEFSNKHNIKIND